MKRWILLFSFVLLFFSLVAFRGYQQARVVSEDEAGEELPVRVLRVRMQTFSEKIHFVGSLEPEEQAAVVPKLKGRTIREVLVQEGQPVKKGQPLAVLDDSLLETSLKQAKAFEARSRATLEQARSQFELSKKDFYRMEKLVEEEVISRQEFDHIRERYEVARATLKAAARALDEAREARRGMDITMSYHRIDAPFDGVVVRRFVDPGDTSDSSSPTFILNRQNNVKVRGSIPERGFTRVRQGQEAQVEVDALDGRIFHGRVSRVSPVVDPVTRTGEVEILLPAEKVLKPGMFVRVALTLGERAYPALPREAVSRLEGTGEWVCYVVSGDRAFLRTIETGFGDGNDLEITGGLSSDEEVIVTRSRFLRDGVRVEVLNR